MKPPAPRRPSRSGSSQSEGTPRAQTPDSASAPKDESIARRQALESAQPLSSSFSTPSQRVVRPIRSATSAASSARRGHSCERARKRRDLARPIGQADAASMLGPSDGAPTASISERRSERTRAKVRLYVTRALYSLVAAALVTVGAWIVFFSEVFALSSANIEVAGVDEQVLTVAEVVSRAAPYEGVPLPRVDTAAIEASVESNVVVADATVSRVWPTGLKIDVALRQVAMAEEVEGGFVLVDAGGVAFRTVPDRPADLPIVSLPVESGRAGAAADASAVWSVLDPSIKQMVAVLTADGKTVSFTLVNGRTVSWGTMEKNDLKAQVLLTLITQRSAQHYDVSSPVHPVTS